MLSVHLIWAIVLAPDHTSKLLDIVPVYPNATFPVESILIRSTPLVTSPIVSVAGRYIPTFVSPDHEYVGLEDTQAVPDPVICP